MKVEKLYGMTTLMDNASDTVLNGEIALMFNDQGNSEIHVTNMDSGAKVVLTEHTPLVIDLVNAIRETHKSFDIMPQSPKSP